MTVNPTNHSGIFYDEHDATALSGLGRDSVTYADPEGRVDCGVIIVTYNSARDIAGLLESLPAAAPGLSVRVVVVDNGSADNTVEIVRAHGHVACIETGANIGYAAGVNLGRQHAGDCAAMAVLNPDLVLEADSLREMLEVLDDPAVGMTVPLMLGVEGSHFPSLRREPSLLRALGDALFGGHFSIRPGWLTEIVRDEREYNYQHSVEWATGAAMLISAKCESAVGPLDESYFLYSEEVDYAARIRAAGYRIDFVPTARVRHRGSGSGRSNHLRALMAVNRVRYIEKRGRRAGPYRAIVLFHALLRCASPGHRLALRAVARRSSWPDLLAALDAARLPESNGETSAGDLSAATPTTAGMGPSHSVIGRGL
jgi:GT2 family glycosyltransferase